MRIDWLSSSAALLEKFLEQVFIGHKMSATRVIQKMRVSEALYKGAHMATLVTTQSCHQAKQKLVRFIFTVSFRRKGSVKAEVRISADILIHLLACCSFTFTL